MQTREILSRPIYMKIYDSRMNHKYQFIHCIETNLVPCTFAAGSQSREILSIRISKQKLNLHGIVCIDQCIVNGLVMKMVIYSWLHRSWIALFLNVFYHKLTAMEIFKKNEICFIHHYFLNKSFWKVVLESWAPYNLTVKNIPSQKLVILVK